jgi:hypothetical protein
MVTQNGSASRSINTDATKPASAADRQAILAKFRVDMANLAKERSAKVQPIAGDNCTPKPAYLNQAQLRAAWTEAGRVASPAGFRCVGRVTAPIGRSP